MRIRINILLVVFLFVGLLAIQLFFILKTWDHTANKLDMKLELILDHVHDEITNNADFKNLLGAAVNEQDSILNRQLNDQLSTFAITDDFNPGDISFEIFANHFSNDPGDFLLKNVAYKAENFNLLKAHHLCLTCILANSYEDKKAYLELGVVINNKGLLQLEELWLPIILSFLFLVLLSVFTIVVLRKWATAQQLNIQKNGFINNLSHELKTPIFSIKLFSQLIIEKAPKSDLSNLDEYGKRIKLEAIHLEEQIHRILESTGLESDHLMRFSKIDLDAFLRNMCPSLQLLCDHNSCQFDFKSDLTKPCIIKADAVHLKNVVNALIDNAIKYTLKNPKVSLVLMQKEAHYVIHIIDNGIGIPDQEKHKVLEKFYRINMSDTNSISGFGLGLFYADQATKKMNGTLEIKNNSPQGTLLSLSFKSEK